MAWQGPERGWQPGRAAASLRGLQERQGPSWGGGWGARARVPHETHVRTPATRVRGARGGLGERNGEGAPGRAKEPPSLPPQVRRRPHSPAMAGRAWKWRRALLLLLLVVGAAERAGALPRSRGGGMEGEDGGGGSGGQEAGAGGWQAPPRGEHGDVAAASAPARPRAGHPPPATRGGLAEGTRLPSFPPATRRRGQGWWGEGSPARTSPRFPSTFIGRFPGPSPSLRSAEGGAPSSRKQPLACRSGTKVVLPLTPPPQKKDLCLFVY